MTSANIEALGANTTLAAYKCSSIDSCTGGSVTGTALMIPNVCGDGYVGDLCGGCKSGWADTGGGKCVRCHSTGVLVFSLILVPSLALIALAVLVSILTHNPKQKSQVCSDLHL